MLSRKANARASYSGLIPDCCHEPVFLPPSVPVDPALLTAGRRIQVTGFCAQYGQIYEIVVRSPRDLKAR